MGYEQRGSLVRLFDAGAREVTRRHVRDLTERGGRRFRELTEERTPIDTGELLSSWRAKPVRLASRTVLGDETWESGVETHVQYAPYVEEGTGLWGPHRAKYLITPKNPNGWLRWIGPDGKPVFAKRVWHQGSPGAHMVANAATVLEAELSAGFADSTLRAWSMEIETRATLAGVVAP